jgi:hypothetical protein
MIDPDTGGQLIPDPVLDIFLVIEKIYCQTGRYHESINFFAEIPLKL